MPRGYKHQGEQLVLQCAGKTEVPKDRPDRVTQSANRVLPHRAGLSESEFHLRSQRRDPLGVTGRKRETTHRGGVRQSQTQCIHIVVCGDQNGHGDGEYPRICSQTRERDQESGAVLLRERPLHAPSLFPEGSADSVFGDAAERLPAFVLHLF